MKWIRWQGLITFLALTVIVAFIWFFFIDSYVERMIEKTGTKANGAKVELDNADLTLFPAGLRITGLQVTNPDKPMVNAVEIKKIAMSLDGLNLLRRKVVMGMRDQVDRANGFVPVFQRNYSHQADFSADQE